MTDEGWVPDACSLPTADRPLRLSEFDELFATALIGQQRVSATRLRWELDASVEATARALAERERSCCSFLTLTFTATGDTLTVDVDVPTEHVPMLDAISGRATAGTTIQG